VTAAQPLPSHRFTVQWDGQDIVGVHRVGALQTTSAGAGVARAPVTLERPAGLDDAFAAWADEAFGGPDATATAKTVRILVHDDRGAPALALVIVGATPVSYSPLGALDAAVSGIAVETLVLTVSDIRRADTAT
jgi:phage tail-like protein